MGLWKSCSRNLRSWQEYGKIFIRCYGVGTGAKIDIAIVCFYEELPVRIIGEVIYSWNDQENFYN